MYLIINTDFGPVVPATNCKWPLCDAPKTAGKGMNPDVIFPLGISFLLKKKSVGVLCFFVVSASDGICE